MGTIPTSRTRIIITNLYSMRPHYTSGPFTDGDKLVAMREATTLKYIHQDHLTGTSLMTSDNGTQMGTTMKYYPYGSTRSGSVPTDKKFTGQRLDDTGLYYYGARYYDPTIGRFISADTFVPWSTGVDVISNSLTVNVIPAGLGSLNAPQGNYPVSTMEAPMNPQALNRYSYVLNNPLKYTDPTGYVNWKLVGIGVTLGIIAVAFTVVAAPVVATALAAEVGFMAVAGVCDLGLLAIAPTLLGGIGGALTVTGLLDKDDDIDPVDSSVTTPQYSTNTIATDTTPPTSEYGNNIADDYSHDYDYGYDYYDYYDYSYDYGYDYYDYYYDYWWY